MVYLFAIFLIIYVLCCLVLVGFILTQEGKGGGLSGVMGASMGETFGFGGATATIRKFTSIAAAVFLLFTIVLTFLGERVVNQYSNAFLNAGGTATPAGAPVSAPAASRTAPRQPGAAGAKVPATGAAQQVEVQPAPAAAAEQAPASAPAPATAPAEAPATK
jgi:preprotein translocase subunit SecG